MSDKTYNGWTNYETWNLALWMDNDQGLYSMRCEAAEDIAKDNEDRSDANVALADWLKQLVEDEQILGALPESGFLADMINAALSEINYYEIAEHWLDDIWDEHHSTEETEESV
jgi:hypothetical protein